jgi:pimeloyl-ACP methyl ester carboxylesterase
LPADSCVLFIHGLVGSTTTWKKFTNHLKNKWTSNESFGIEFYQYTTEISIPLPIINTITKAVAGSPSIENVAKGLKTVIDEECKDYQNVIIVAHSMGGLVARQYLIDVVKSNKEVGKVKALITYATPHKGATIATWFRIFGKYFLFPFFLTFNQIIQMCRIQSNFIQKLNKDWDFFRIESKIDFTRVVGLMDFIVDKDSASLNWSDPNVKYISNKGHSSIIKPRRNTDTAFMITFNYLKDFKLNLEKRVEQEELDRLAEDEQENEE